jgi:hypothetical protein
MNRYIYIYIFLLQNYAQELIHHCIQHLGVRNHPDDVRKYWEHIREYCSWGKSHPAAACGTHTPVTLYGDDARLVAKYRLIFMLHLNLILIYNIFRLVFIFGHDFDGAQASQTQEKRFWHFCYHSRFGGHLTA